MDTKKFPYWLAVEESKLVKFADLAHMMAKAIHPSETEGVAYGSARINLEKELPDAVHNGDLIVRNVAGMGKHQFPYGNALQLAVILPLELRPFLEGRGIELRLMAHGSGPMLWTLENAASAIAEQEEWHNSARGRLLDQMMEAAIKRELIVRDPHTNLPKATGEIREYYELVTPADVNEWLDNNWAPYRWDVTMPVRIAGVHEQWESLVREDDERRLDTAYKAKYDRAYELHGKIALWERMAHQNDPIKAKMIEAELSMLYTELAEIDKPAPATPEPQPTPASDPLPPAAAQTAKAPVSKPQKSAEGITKEQVLIAFAELVKPFDLKKALGNGKGLFGDDGARTQRGSRGARHAALWNPVFLAVGLHEKYAVPMPHLKRTFFDHPFLRRWSDEWSDTLDRFGE